MEKLLKQLIGRVDLLIKLQVLTGLKDWNQSEKVIGLYNMGVQQAEVASILGIKINNVTSIVSRELKKNQKVLKKKEANTVSI